jgi:hypothetical protein
VTATYHLRSYEKATGQWDADIDLTPAQLPIVRGLLPETEYDPDLVHPRGLSRDQAVELAERIGVTVEPDNFDYFVEADEDWRVVASRRDGWMLSYVREMD